MDESITVQMSDKWYHVCGATEYCIDTNNYLEHRPQGDQTNQKTVTKEILNSFVAFII